MTRDENRVEGRRIAAEADLRDPAGLGRMRVVPPRRFALPEATQENGAGPVRLLPVEGSVSAPIP
ncbi:hypothetical protein [Streptomyces sp. NPDC002535]